MKKDEEILRLIDAAIDACQKAMEEAASKGESWMVEDAETAQRQFKKIADQVRSRTLSSSRGGGLGITRGLGEWAPYYLYSAGKAVEDFYKQNW